MNIKIFTAYLSIILWFMNIFSIPTSFKHVNHAGLVYQETIQVIQNEQILGYVSFIKIPLLHICVVHSFYIYPKYRNHGYGTQLLLYVCDYLATQGVYKIYVQPGPFELPNVPSGNGLNTQQLIKLYTKCGFEPVNKLTSKLASFLYLFMNINENSRYLMVEVT